MSLGALALQQGSQGALLAPTPPQQLPGSGLGVCLPGVPAPARPGALQCAEKPAHAGMQQAVPPLALLPFPLPLTAPVAAATGRPNPAAGQPVPTRLPAGQTLAALPAGQAEGAGESGGLELDAALQSGQSAGATAAAVGAQLPDSSLPPDRARVEAQLRALGATLLFEKVGEGCGCGSQGRGALMGAAPSKVGNHTTALGRSF